MLGRLIKDESGIAMGLAVIVVLLVGVMGAGLLVFVRNDLEAVVEVNQGQNAFDAADAGIQAAKRELLSDACPESYDGSGAGAEDDQNACADSTESDWSYAAVAGENADAGKVLDFDGKQVEVGIRWLVPASTDSETQEEGFTPVKEGNYPENREYFEIESAGNSENGDARRKVEAIYYTSNLNVPNAYYTPENIEFKGNVSVSGVSFFAGGNIEGSQSGSVTFDRDSSTIYGDWDTTQFESPSDYNTEPREDELGNDMDGAGLGAEGLICNNNCSDSVADGVYDYDSTTDDRGSGKKFIRKDPPDGPQTSSEISYPFVPSNSIEEIFDIQFLREEAQRQNNYEGSPVYIDDGNYPSDSDDQTVFFVDAQGDTGDLEYRVNTGDDSNKAEGIIVVKDGNLKISNSSNGFKGVIIITGNGTDTGFYRSIGNTTVEGFVVSDGNMILRGDVAPLAAGDFTNRPGFYGVDLWSWRECYSEACN